MLYGNIVFIKKSGGDGSKYPVTEKMIKIGKSEECLIRIYNPHVAPVHCHLIIGDNGQAKLKNLSSLTVLNGKPMGQNEMTLCHGDIFKLGERHARWEYLPSSKYYKQILSPSGRLVAVVIPQQRSMEQETVSTPRILRKTPTGGKRKLSERGTSENLSVSKKIAKIGNSSVSKTNKSVAKFLAGNQGLQSTKKLFSPRVKQRKSTSGVPSSKISKVQVTAKIRKSTLPSWKVNLISSPSEINLEGNKSPISRITSPKSTESLIKSVNKSAVKIQSLKKLSDSQLQQADTSVTLARKLSASPSVKVTTGSAKKLTPKTKRLINSERKVQSSSRKSSKSSKRLSLSFKATTKTPTKAAVKKMFQNLSKTVSPSTLSRRSPKNSSPEHIDSSVLVETPKNTHDKSRTMKTPAESQKSSPLTRKSKKMSVKVVSPKSSPKSLGEFSSSGKKTPVKYKKTPAKPATPFPVSPGKKLSRSMNLSPVKVSSAKKSTRKSKKRSLISVSPSIFTPEKNESILKSPYASFSEMLPFSSKSPKPGTSVKASTPFKVSTGKKKLKTRLSPILSPAVKDTSIRKTQGRKSAFTESTLQKDGASSPGKEDFSAHEDHDLIRTSLKRGSSKGSSPKSKKTPLKSSAKKSPIKKTPAKTVSPAKKAISGAPQTGRLSSSRSSPIKNSPKSTTTTTHFPNSTLDFLKTFSKELEIPNVGEKVSRMNSSASFSPIKTPKAKKSPERRTTPNSKQKSHASVSPEKKVATPAASRTSTSRSPGVKSPVKPKKTPLKIVSPKVLEGEIPVESVTKRTFKEKASSTPARGRSSVKKTGSVIKLTSKDKSKSPRGIRRKLSPSISAERAAKKLKISTPKKPDKNKKAALMVLGIANRKQLMSQNVKVLLKQKIVKKAIKQSKAVSGSKDEKIAKVAIKKIQESKKVMKKGKKKPKLKKKVSKSPKKSPKGSTPTKEKIETPAKDTSKTQIRLSVLKTPSSSLKTTESSSSSPTKSVKNFSSPAKQISSKTSPVKQSPLTILDAYAFNANRRASKRLSSKNDITRPDFTELSPTALGLIPKHIEMFKTPKEKKRRSLSLATPKNIRTISIIKSASTSKIGNRKSVRFSAKDISIHSPIYDSNISQGTEFDFESIKTPDITMETFVSPLTEKKLGSFTNPDLNKSAKTLSFADETLEEPPRSPVKVTRKISQTPSPKMSPKKTSPGSSTKKVLGKRSSPKKIAEMNVQRTLRSPSKSPKNKINLSGVKSLFTSPEIKKIPNIDLSRAQRVTPSRTGKVQSSPKGVSPDLRKENKLLLTPKVHLEYLPKQETKKLVQTPSPKKSATKATPSSSNKKVSNRISPKKLTEISNQRQLRNSTMSPKNGTINVPGVKSLFKSPDKKKSPKSKLNETKSPGKSPKIDLSLQNDKTLEKSSSPKNDLPDLRVVKKLLQTPKVQKSPKNDLTNVAGVKRLMKTPRQQKSPKNDLSNVQGVKQLMKTPKQQKSPRNDLSNVAGVKQLMKTPRQQKSPKNDLTNVAGVKKLMRTPKQQKSPKNDLTNVAGVKKLMKTPKEQKSPKNDLTNIAGLKRLMKTPREQNSPKNDLTDLRGVRQLLGSPKPVKSPKNDLTNVAGVKKLMRTPKEQKSPKNDLTNIAGLKRLMKTPREQSSPKNDLSDLRGVRQLLGSPKPIKSPKNDLSDLTGVRQLFTSRYQRSPKNDLLEISGVGNLFRSPKTVENYTYGEREILKSPLSPKGLRNTVNTVTGVKQLLVSNSSGGFSNSPNTKVKSQLNSFKAIRGRRTIYSTPKGPKNDLSDLTGVKELFLRNEPVSDLSIRSSVAQLFDFPATEFVKKQETVKTKIQKVTRGRKASESSKQEEVTKVPGRKVRPRNVSNAKPASVSVASKKIDEVTDEVVEIQTSKRKAVAKIASPPQKKTLRGRSKAKISPPKVSKGKKKTSPVQTPVKAVEVEKIEVRSSRKRKADVEKSEPSPPKLKRKQAVVKGKVKSSPKKETSKRATSSRRQAIQSPKKPPVSKSTSADAKSVKFSSSKKVQSKTATPKTSAKSILKVQKRSQSQTPTEKSKSSETVSPRKTRSGKAVVQKQETKVVSKESKSKVQKKTVGLKTSKTASAKKKVSTAIRRSTRRK